MTRSAHQPSVALALAMSVSLALAACGGDSGSDATQAQDSSSAPVADEQATTEEPGDAPADVAVATTPAPVADRTVTIAATGDVLPHSSVLGSAQANAGGGDDYDFGPMFAEIEPLISAADLALCHLETPLSADNTNLTKSRVLIFNTPREMASNLVSAGYDGCDFASNHTMDQGLQGLKDTEDVMTEAGLGYAGPTGYQDRAPAYATYEANGVSVAHLAYTYTFPNASEPNTDVPTGLPWLAENSWPIQEAEGIASDADKARSEGAELVVVSMHWGAEYQRNPTQDQTDLAQALLDSGDADLILGTHVHLPQACAEINDRFVLYGLGNSLSNQSPQVDSRLRTATQEGMVAQVTLTLSGDGTVRSELAVQPTRVNLEGHVIEPTGPDHYPETSARTGETLTSLGSCSPKILAP